MIEAIHLVLLVPGGVATDGHAEAVRRAIPRLQQWWEAQGAPLLWLDPKTPHCPELLAWFTAYPGGAFYGAQDFAVRRGYTQGGRRALVILQGYRDGHGEAGPSVGVVGYGAVADLTAGGEAADCACGLLCHEAAHTLGLAHMAAPNDLMNEMGAWVRWPRVGLSVRPTAVSR